MNFLNFFRRPSPIATPTELADFIDANAAFIAQKGIYEYSRARAGHYSKVLFGEKEFQDAIELSRWRSYPLGLAMVAEMVEGLLHPAAGEDRPRVVEAIRILTLKVFDRYPVPNALGESAWQALREELSQRLQSIGLHPPKRAIDIPEPFARSYFDLMPIHEKLRGAEFPTTRNYMRVTLGNMHDELTKRIKPDAMIAILKGLTGHPAS